MICRVVIVSDTLRPALEQLAEEVGGEGANEAIGKAVSMEVIRHLRERNLEPNKLGGKKTGFWEELAREVSYVAGVDYSETNIPAPAKHKWDGGWIYGRVTATNPKGLLIFPIAAETYGVEYKEWRSAHPDDSAKGLFAFATKVNQKADPNTLPPDDALLDRAEAALLAHLEAVLN